MAKRILAMVLVLAMVCSILPMAIVSADTADEVVASPKAGTHTDAGHGDDCGVTTGWQEWTSATSLPKTGQYILTKDVTVSSETVLTGDLTLCLNGYVIKSTGANRIIGTKKDADTTLTICDCTAYTDENGVYQAGALTGGVKKADGGGAIFVRRGGVLKFYDGRVTGNTYQSDTTSVGGGAVMLQAKSGDLISKAFIYGGEFTNNKSVKADGTTPNTAGAICVGGSGELTVEGGLFSGNSASSGGAIYGASGTVKISGATITGNTASTSGSAIHNNGAMQLTIGEGTVITGNTSASTSTTHSYAAAVSMVGTAGKLTLTGKVYIADNNINAKGIASVAFDKAASDTLYVNELAAGSYVEFSTPLTVPTEAAEVIALDGTQTAWSSGWVAFMAKDGTLQHIGKDDTGFKFVTGHFHENVEYLPLTSADQLIAGGAYYLDAETVTLDKAVALTGTTETSICLNGHTLKSTATAAAPFSTATANDAATFNVDDCTAYTDDQGVYHAGAIDGLQNKSTGHGGGAFMIRAKGTLNFYGGKITNCTAVVGGGAIFANGAVNLYGGEISGNKSVSGTAAKNGGAIYVNYNASNTTLRGTLYAGNVIFKENDAPYGKGGAVYAGGPAEFVNCQFIDNNSGSTGGVIHIGNGNTTVDGCVMTGNTANAAAAINLGTASGSLTVKDTTITGNSAVGGYGAINVIKDTKPVVLKGKVVITDNTHGTVIKNFHVQKTNVTDAIDATGLTGGSVIGITLESGRTVSTFSTASASNNAAYFVNDVDGYVVELNADNKLQLTQGAVAPVVHNHTACGDTGCTDHGAEITYEAWTDAASLPTEGNWYLDTDVTVSAEVQLKAHTLNLCLNGHTITGYTGKGARAYSTTANTAASINISDCTAKTENGVYTAGKFTDFNNTHTDSGGGAIYVRAGSTLNFFDGIVENCKAASGGGAIYVHTATANIYGGLITDNQAISGTTWKSGAGLFMYKATVNVYGGEISGNKAAYGGGIYLADGTCKLTLQDVKVIDNVATGDSAGVHAAYTASTLKLGGNVVITGNAKTNGAASNLRLGSTGKMVLGELGKDAKIGLTASASRALSNAVTSDVTGIFTSDDAALVVAMTANNEVQLKPAFEHVHCVCGKTDCTDTTHQKVEYAAWSDATSLPADGSYCLTTDVTVSSEVQIADAITLNLCLHGHTITGYTGNGARAYSTTANKAATINISDCTAKTEDGVYTAGKFTGFNNTHKDSGGAAIYIRAGSTLNFYDGIVENCTAGSGGGALYGHTSTINMHGGLFTNNQAKLDDAWKNGAGIFLYKATLNMTGGTITGNKAAYGAGIHLADGTSKLYISGGTITGNIATGDGGGVNAAYKNAVISISGDVMITGNTTESGKASNLRLGSTGTMTVSDLAATAKIGVTASARRAISTETLDYTAQVTSDDTKMVVIYQDKVLYMASSSTHKHCLCAGTTATGCDHTVEQFDEWDDPNTLPTSGSYYLSVDVALTGTQTRLENGTLNLCLNGHTITASKSSGRAFYMTNGATLNITDCAGGGKLTGATKGAILTNAKGTDMELNLYAGTFTENHANSTGGALVMQGDVTFNMYGGKVTGNSATSYLNYDENGEVELDANGNQSAEGVHAGGVYVGGGATFNMYGGEISGNTASKIDYLKAGATSTTATGGYGGGLYATSSIVNIYGGKITGNAAHLGGGVFASGKTGKLNIMGGEISENTAASGGGVITQTLIVTDMSGGSIKNNRSTGAGAGFYVSTGTTLNMTGGEISGNVAHNGTAYKSGGGLYLLASTMNMSGGTVSGNKGLNGGGIAMGLSGTRYPTLNISGDALITGNVADSNGGGIFATGEGTKITITGGTLSNNKAKNGGAIITQTKSALEMSAGKITGNQVTASGGGFYISTNTSFLMTGGSITGNTSKSSGGGVTVLRAKATFKGGEISYNTGSEAGALKVNGGTITISGISMVGNKAIGTLNKTTGLYTGGNGGAIVFGRAGYKVNGVQMYDCPVINIYSIYAAYNKANAAAGALLLQSDGTQFHMYGGTFAYNEAPNSNGGAIYFSTKSRPNVYGGTFYGNKAKNAGALYFLNTTGNISGLKIYDNEVTTAGAAFIVTGKETVIEMKDMEIYDNVAQGAAGAFTVQGYATLNLENAKVYGNTAGSTAGAIYFSNPGYGNFKNIEIYENETQKEAGGMYVGPASIVKLDNVTVRDNEAVGNYGGGIYCRGRLEIQNSKILNNTVGGEGGGLATWKSSSILLGQDAGVYAENCVISGNKAGTHGGGVYNQRGGPIYLEGCTITDNTAGLEGGGVYSDGRLGLVDATVTGNVSGGEGFAVYLTAGEFDGHSYSTGHKKIGGNMIIKDNQGGDFYMGEGSAVAVVGGPLGEKSHMEITLHSGVLSEHLFGVYNYEGGDLVYTVTAGDRSLTDPEDYTNQSEDQTAQQDDQSEKAGSSDVLLYVGIGVIALAVIIALVLVMLKKKKAGKTAEKATKE